LFVYVINKNDKPLMPTTPAKARKLLKSGKAKVIKRTPFTIKLLFGSSGYTQNITLGVDSGSKVIGLSAVTEKQELYSGEIELRNDIGKLLADRASLRRGRRSRKTRYRKARFMNRKKPKEWLAPSVEHKVNSHLRIIEKLHRILPITKIRIEIDSFDIQKIKNPEISGKDYQNGNQLNFWNVREYVLFRDGHKCRHCNGKSKDNILNVHHIESRKTGGDAPNNLITLCESCHKNYHNGNIILKVKRGNSLRDAAFMGIMRWSCYNKLKEIYPNVELTYGYITKNLRINSNLHKEHRIDALCVTGKPLTKQVDTYYRMRFVRKHNRQIHKLTINKGGTRKMNQSPYEVKGFRLFDKVLYEKKEYFIFGRRLNGGFDVRDLSGNKVKNGNINIKYLKLIGKRTSILNERVVIPPQS